MDLYNFLPMYPEFEDDVRKILGSTLVESKQPNYDIYRKKEFYDYKLEKTEEKPTERGKLMNHQMIISRFLSSHTPYNGILIMHEPGTGKTCSSVGVIEQIRREQSMFKGALVIMKGKSLIDNYVNELVFTCTDGSYIPENYEELTENEKIRRVRKSISSFYEFQTFEVFSKMIRKMRDTEIIKRFSNLIIVIDEAHNLRITDDKSQYESIHRFLHTVVNCKSILLTGTPMRDQPQEIASILNLILPSKKQLPIGDEFVEEYLEEYGDSMIVQNSMKKKLKSYMHGRVSYLRAMKSDVKREYVGEHLDLKYFNLFPIEMEDFQLQQYKKAYNIDKKDRKGVYNNSQQSCLFVFPDGTYGNTGYKTYVQEKKVKDVEGKVKSSFSLKKDLIDELRSGTTDEKLQKLRKFSCKYAQCIENILKNKNNHFVYMEYVEGSGAILFSKILELFGFSQSKGNEKNPGLRYSIITNRTSTAKEIRDILKTYNNPQNMDGKYIRVIIGSKVIGEGFSLKNVQNVHVLTPSWNFSQTDQAIARAFRLFSHSDLEKAGIDVTVKIYLYCALTSDIKSIDLYMYKTSEDKDISIKSVERLIKEASFDCSLNRDRNVLPIMFNGSRECDYSFCDYKCDGVSEQQIEDPEIDIATYNLFYDEKDTKEAINRIKIILSDKTSIKLQELLEYLNDFSEFTVIKALDIMNTNNIIVKDVFGFNSFVRYDNDYVYCTYSLSSSGNFFDNYYLDNFCLQQYNSFDSQVNKIYSENLPSLLEKLKKEKTNSKKMEFLRNFVIEAQELMLEMSLLSTREGVKNADRLREFIIDNFAPYILQLNNTKVSTLLFDEKNIFRCLEKDSKEWENCSNDYKEKIEEIMKNKKNQIVGNKYGYYGIVESKTGRFLIRDVSEEDKKEAKDNRLKTSGRVCKTSWDKKDLVKLVDLMKFEFDSSELQELSKEDLSEFLDNKKYKDVAKVYSKQEFLKKSKDDIMRILYWGKFKKGIICDRIKKWFEDNNLLEIIVSKK